MLMNAFPLQVVADGSTIRVTSATHEEARAALCVGSAIGHADTARLLETILETRVVVNRVTMPTTAFGDVVVAQFTGPRLPEGATELPPGAKIEFRRVRWEPAPTE